MTQSWIVNCKVSPKASTVFVWPSPSSPYNLWMPAQRARCLPALRVCKQRYRWTEGNRGHTSRLKQLSWRRRSSCGGAGTRGGRVRVSNWASSQRWHEWRSSPQHVQRAIDTKPGRLVEKYEPHERELEHGVDLAEVVRLHLKGRVGRSVEEVSLWWLRSRPPVKRAAHENLRDSSGTAPEEPTRENERRRGSRGVYSCAGGLLTRSRAYIIPTSGMGSKLAQQSESDTTATKILSATGSRKEPSTVCGGCEAEQYPELAVSERGGGRRRACVVQAAWQRGRARQLARAGRRTFWS